MKLVFTSFLFMLFSLGYSQEYNKEIELENGKKFLLGKINLDGLKAEPYQTWFTSNYEAYSVDKSLVKVFESRLADCDIKLFLGTWCGDSKREVPRFVKILKAAKFPMEQLEIVALDRRKGLVKTSPTGEEKGLNIIKVPTMIFLKNGKEINRIVESPIESLEEDIALIAKQQPYTPHYATLSKTE